MTTERADRYLSADAGARYLGVSRRTFFKHVRASVRSVHIGGRVVFDTVDLDNWAEAHKTAAVVEQTPADRERLMPAHARPGSVRKLLRQLRAQTPVKESRPVAQPPKAVGAATARLRQLRKEGKIK